MRDLLSQRRITYEISRTLLSLNQIHHAIIHKKQYEARLRDLLIRMALEDMVLKHILKKNSKEEMVYEVLRKTFTAEPLKILTLIMTVQLMDQILLLRSIVIFKNILVIDWNEPPKNFVRIVYLLLFSIQKQERSLLWRVRQVMIQMNTVGSMILNWSIQMIMKI